MKFIKIFQNPVKAESFAKEHGGQVNIQYDWDTIKNRMIKIYIVKY